MNAHQEAFVIDMVCSLCGERVVTSGATIDEAEGHRVDHANGGWISHERVLFNVHDICPSCVATLSVKLGKTSGPSCPAEEDTNMRAAGKSPDRVEASDRRVTGASPRDGASEATGPRKPATGSGSKHGCVVGALADGACEKSASQSDETQTERVYRAVEAWVRKMSGLGVERVYEAPARYHLTLTIKALLAEEREACAKVCDDLADANRESLFMQSLSAEWCAKIIRRRPT